MFEQTFRNIDDVLWKEAGCATEMDYTEQTSWLLFLKYLDDLEQERALEAELLGKDYTYLLEGGYRWSSWAAPKTADGEIDHDKVLIGDDLIDFVNTALFPYLQGFKQRASSPNTIEYKIGEIFGEIKNKFQSGYSLRDALEYIDELRFGSQEEKHELSHLYEAKIKNMGNAGRNGGEYYTPRSLIRAMVQVVRPQLGETIYDGACGSAGFLCDSYEYLRRGQLTTQHSKICKPVPLRAKRRRAWPM
nr:N-6 DNA methylase [Halomicronema sp. CCY15110]